MRKGPVIIGAAVAGVITLGIGITTLDRFMVGREISTQVYAPIRYSFTLQSPQGVKGELETVQTYLIDNGLTEGNTCLFYASAPKCELASFSRTIQENITLVSDLGPDASTLEVTNALSRVTQSFTGNDGILDHPDLSIVKRWGTDPYMLLLGKMVDTSPYLLLVLIWLFVTLVSA